MYQRIRKAIIARVDSGASASGAGREHSHDHQPSTIRGRRRSRRGGMLIGVRFSGLLVRAQESDPGAKQKAPNPFVAYVHVKPDGKISLIVAKSEMGQGIKTGLAMVLAERPKWISRP